MVAMSLPSRPRRPWLTTATALATVAVVSIGVAHVRAAGLESGDVVWTSPSAVRAYDGREMRVVGDRVLLRNHGEPSLFSLADGTESRVEAPFDPRHISVGEDGHFAMWDVDELSVHRPDGGLLWTREVGSTQVHAMDDGAVTHVVCGAEGCAAVHRDREGREVWHRPRARKGAFRGSTTPEGEWDGLGLSKTRVVPSLPVGYAKGEVHLLRDGRPLGEPVALSDEADSVQVDGRLIGVTEDDSRCVYEAVREGRPLWRTTVDCPSGAGESLIRVAEGRLFVVHAGEGSREVVSIDTADGTASTFELDGDWPVLRFTSRALVVVEGERIRGLSPTTGREMWSHERQEQAAVDVDEGVLAVQRDTPGPVRWLAVGRAVPTETTVLRDTVTGDEIASVASSGSIAVRDLGEGRALLHTDQDLMLVDWR